MKVSIKSEDYDSLAEQKRSRVTVNFQAEAEKLNLSEDIYRRIFDELVDDGCVTPGRMTKEGCPATLNYPPR